MTKSVTKRKHDLEKKIRALEVKVSELTARAEGAEASLKEAVSERDALRAEKTAEADAKAPQEGKP